MRQCQLCKRNVAMPFTCSYCGQTFCDEHGLPENHRCTALPRRDWKKYREVKTRQNPVKSKRSAPIDYEAIRASKQPEQYHRNKSKTVPVLLLLCLGVIGIVYLNDPNGFTSSISSLGDQVNEFINNVTNQVIESTKPPSTEQIEQHILEYTNMERSKNGLKALEWDSRLAEIAREHSQDMAENDFFSHTNLDGEDPTDRAKRHSYPLYKELGGGYYSEGIAENISKMPTGNVVGRGYVSNDAESIATAVVDGWMNSEGHRKNILNSGYDRIGVGVAYDGDTYYLCTQNFW